MRRESGARGRACAVVLCGAFWCVAACGAVSGGATGPSPTQASGTISGRSAFVVFDCSKDVVTLLFRSAHAPVAVRTRDVTPEVGAAPTLATTPVPTPAWTLVWTKPVATEPAINEYQSVGSLGNGCPLPGRFRVGVDLIAGVAGETNERLEFGLERAADPSLYVPTQVSLNLVTNPLAPGAALLSPTVLLKEESYSSPLGAVSVSPGELKNASGDLVGIQIQPARATPIEVPSGRSAELTLALSATPSPGVYTSRVSLHSPELRQTVNMDVTLKVRVASVFLLLILVGGVALGWGVNVVLAGRAKLDAALLEALRAADGLVKRAQAQQDPAVQQRILRVAAGLEAALGQAQTVENVQDLVKTAQGQVSAIEAQAATDAKNLAEALATARAVFTDKGAPLDPLVEDLLRGVRGDLARVEAVAGSGGTEEAARELAAFNLHLPRAAMQVLDPWLAAVNGALGEFGPWALADAKLAQARDALKASVGSAYPRTDPALLVAESDHVAVQLRAWMDLDARFAIARAFRTAAVPLRDADLADLAASLSKRADDVSSLTTGDPLAGLNALVKQCEDVAALLRAAVPPSPELDTWLLTGDFTAAALYVVNTLRPSKGPVEAGQAGPAALAAATTRAPMGLARALMEPLPYRATALAPPPIPAVLPRILVAPDLVAGNAARVALAWADAVPSGVEVHWSCTPAQAADIARGDPAGTELKPIRPGSLRVSALINGQDTVTALTFIGDVMQSPDYVALQQRARRLNGLIWTVTALITVGFGYETFVTNWFGSLSDFMSAFLWGFFGQFGLDRIRDLAKPAIGKTVPG